MFLCSAGDIFEHRPSQGASVPETQEKASTLARVLGLMGYDAIALGEKDLAFGKSFLDGVVEEFGLSVVCANAVDSETDELLFQPYVVRERDGLRVAFLGVVSPERHIVAQVESGLLKHHVRIEDPSEAARRYLPEIRRRADLAVLLSHTGVETSELLAETLGYDVVVVGHYPGIESQPRRVGESLLVMAGSKSDRFGTLELTLAEEGPGITQFRGEAVHLLKEGVMDEQIWAISQEADRRDKEARRERQLAAQRRREALARQNETQRIHERGGIIGAESCRSCHEPLYESWLETPHATAFATLAESDAWDKPECVGCHVTGILDKTHVDDVNVPPEQWNVQCEECHGSGLQHARDGSYLPTGEATCRKCHDPENSPNFDYEVYSSYGVH